MVLLLAVAAAVAVRDLERTYLAGALVGARARAPGKFLGRARDELSFLLCEDVLWGASIKRSGPVPLCVRGEQHRHSPVRKYQCTQDVERP